MTKETGQGSVGVVKSKHEPALVPGTLALGSQLITTGQPITDSGNQVQRIFIQANITLGSIDPTKFKVTISSLPDTDAPIIADDALIINGRLIGGFASVKVDPKTVLGQDPIVAYNPIEAVDITQDLRSDGHLFFQAVDLGGYTFCCSRLYLRVAAR